MITVAGVGPGNPKYLTVEVRNCIKESKCVVAFERVAYSLKDIRKDFLTINSVKEIFPIVKKNKELLILASGDPCFFGILAFLKKKGINVDKVLNGISSFQYMMGKLMKSWDKAKFLTVHGRKENIKEVVNNPLTVILTDKDNNPLTISKELYGLGITGNIYAGFNLSYDDEVIVKKKIGEEIKNISSLAVVVIENEMDKR